MIVFLHIPKTAGTFIANSIFRNNCNAITMEELRAHYYSDGYLSTILCGDRKLDLVPDGLIGHVPYGIHHAFTVNPSEVAYFTVLREPVSRWLSEFYFSVNEVYIRAGWSEYSALYDVVGHDFNKFLQHCLEAGWGMNKMVRQLSGLEDIREIESRTIERRRNYLQGGRIRSSLLLAHDIANRLQRSLRYTGSLSTATKVYNNYKYDSLRKRPVSVSNFHRIWYGLNRAYRLRRKGWEENSLAVYSAYWNQSRNYSNDEMERFLDAAKRNLEHFKFVGFQDNLALCTDRLIEAFGWMRNEKLGNGSLPRIRVRDNSRISPIDLDESMLEKVRALNHFDIKLYEWAKTRFG